MIGVTVEAARGADDPLAIFEATFGSGAGVRASVEGQGQITGMRGRAPTASPR